MLFLGEFLAGEALLVDGAPGVDDVGQDEGDDERDARHGGEGEVAGTTVGQGERTLEVGRRGVVGRVVVSHHQQQSQYGADGSDAGRPNASAEILLQQGGENAEKHEANTYQQQGQNSGQGEQARLNMLLVFFMRPNVSNYIRKAGHC